MWTYWDVLGVFAPIWKSKKASRFSYSLDTTTKTNGKNRPVADTNAIDSNFKSLLVLLSLLRNEIQKSFIFIVTCLGRIYGLNCLKAMSMFLSDRDKQIKQTVRQCVSLRIFNPKVQ